MFLKNIFILFILLTLFGCKPKQKVYNNISCNGDFILQYDKKRGHYQPLADLHSNGFIVYFIDEFDDHIKGFVNDKLYFDKHVKINQSEDGLHEYFACSLKQFSELPILKIISETQQTCVDLKVDRKYKLIYVYLSRNGKWTIRFSNRHLVFP